MNFVNNWAAPVTLALGQLSSALSLPDGVYRLTVSDSLTAPTRWEHIDAAMASGQALLTRGREGTGDQDWPSGSVIYQSVTAGFLASLLDQLADLQARVKALEDGPATGNTLTDDAGRALTGAAGEILTTGEKE